MEQVLAENNQNQCQRTLTLPAIGSIAAKQKIMTSLFFFSTLDLKICLKKITSKVFLFAGYLLLLSDIRLTLY